MSVRALSLVAVLALAVPVPVLAADDLEAWARAIAEQPADAAGYEGYALAALAQHRWDDAVAKLRAGIARVPQFNRGYYLLAVAHRSRGDWAEAASYYRVCLSLNQQTNDARYGLSKVLIQLGDRAGAMEALSRYIGDERDPAKAPYVEIARRELESLSREARGGGGRAASSIADVASLRAEATRLQRAGQLEAAAAAWRRVVEASPPDAFVQNELGTVLFGLRRYDEAIAAFQRATEIDRRYAVAWFNLANAYRKAGRVVDAVHAAERFVELEPNDPDGWYALAQAREATGDARGALSAYDDFVARERRPDRRKLIEKAERSAGALRVSLASVPVRTAEASIERDDVMPMTSTPRIPDLRDPFDVVPTDASDTDSLLNPSFSHRGRSGAAATGDGLAAQLAESARAREYAAAVANYQRALAAHADRVAARYEKGVSLAIAGRFREAGAAWDGIGLEDTALAGARKTLARMRSRAR